jgi:predicted GH43/DUF377 family glycosyl hydrolase
MIAAFLLLSVHQVGMEKPWMLGPFTRTQTTPTLRADASRTYLNAITGQTDAWMSGNAFNPALAVRNDELILLFRAEDAPGLGVGHHTSTIGYAESQNGHTFAILDHPVLFPARDHQRAQEWLGGCEDPRVVAVGGVWYMTYTAYNGKVARLSIATSPDLKHWQKRGPALAGRFDKDWSKSGSIVTRRVGEHLEVAKIHGRYWMYFRDGKFEVASSTDLIHWTEEASGTQVLSPRRGAFDSGLCEPGPPALLTPNGVVLLYNGVNATKNGDPSLRAGQFSAGEALFSADDPAKLVDRSTKPILQPELPWERTGQYAAGTVFIEGLARFHGHWLLSYGAADSRVGLAEAP